MANWHHIQSWFRRTFRNPQTQSLGSRGEHLAAKHLRTSRYQILGRNLQSKLGEIDILAQDPDRRTVVVVEVKTSATKSSHAFNSTPPELHVNKRKQRKLVNLACHFVRRYGFTDRPIRFDVVGVDLPEDGGTPAVRHHVGAFESHV